MGQLRTANNRRNRAIRNTLARTRASAGQILPGAEASTAKKAAKPAKARS